MTRVRKGQERLARSVTLLRVFLLASAVVLALGAAVLGSILTRSLRAQALESSEAALTQYVDGVLARELVEDGRLRVSDEVPRLEAALADHRAIFSLKVWTPDGTLAWASLAPERIGKRFPVDGHLREVLETGHAEAELEPLHNEENAVEAAHTTGDVIEVYAPVLSGGDVVGAYEIYADASSLEALMADRRRVIWLATGAVFLTLWAVLALLVRGASAMMRRQARRLAERTRQLAESYRRLEESSIEAIETLNAAVEAKDPYTAGHSLRVQRAALAIAAQLRFTPLELDAVRLGGLFHDIGKIAVPDSLLTKAAKLDYWEFAQMKTHSAEGARIVAKLTRLKETIPIVRHHHERWDGEGYPDGLAGADIPVAATVVGLADAWDAMTTTRPYHRALTQDEALEELRRGRGTQFAPAVVDAFFEVLRRTPQELGLDAKLSAAG